MDFYVFSLLPFGLLSAWLHRKENHRHTAGFGWFAALAPVVAKGLGSLIGSKQKKAAAKQQEEQAKLEAQQRDALAKQEWEAQQNSPAAQAARFKSTLALGRLAGAMGGSLDKLPPSIRNYYQSQRTMPEYSGVSSYVPTAQKGGGGWDFAAGLTDALSYLDTSKLGGGGSKLTAQTGFGAGSSFGGAASAMTGGGGSTNPLVGLTQRLKPGGLATPKY